MRIGLNLLYLVPGVVGGTEVYAWNLLRGLQEVSSTEEFSIFLNSEARYWEAPHAPNFVRHVCPVNGKTRLRRYLYEQGKFCRYLRDSSVDILHSAGYVTPLATRCPSVVTIHDLNYRNYPMPLGKRVMLAAFVRLSALKADKIIVPSEFSRREVLTAFRVPADRIRRIHEGVDHHAITRVKQAHCETRRATRVQRPYIIAFSSSTPNKNILRLLAAFRRARRQGLPHHLVLVGHPCPAVAKSTEDDGVLMTGYLDRDELLLTLIGAELLVFPSTYEGFGLPILEAMACGVPVVCSNRGALPETAGGACVLFDPFSEADIARVMLEVACDPGRLERLREQGTAHAARFSWTRTAQETLDVYREVFARTATC